jgi:hypothetical protein
MDVSAHLAEPGGQCELPESRTERPRTEPQTGGHSNSIATAENQKSPNADRQEAPRCTNAFAGTETSSGNLDGEAPVDSWVSVEAPTSEVDEKPALIRRTVEQSPVLCVKMAGHENVETPLYLHSSSSQPKLSSAETTRVGLYRTRFPNMNRVRVHASKALGRWSKFIAEELRSGSLVNEYSAWVTTVLVCTLLVYLLTITISILYAVLCAALTVLVSCAGAITAAFVWIALLLMVSIPIFVIVLVSLLGATTGIFALKVGLDGIKSNTDQIEDDDDPQDV